VAQVRIAQVGAGQPDRVQRDAAQVGTP